MPGGIVRIVYVQIELVLVGVVNAGRRVTRCRSGRVLQRHPGLENTPELDDAEQEQQQNWQRDRKFCQCLPGSSSVMQLACSSIGLLTPLLRQPRKHAGRNLVKDFLQFLPGRRPEVIAAAFGGGFGSKIAREDCDSPSSLLRTGRARPSSASVRIDTVANAIMSSFSMSRHCISALSKH